MCEIKFFVSGGAGFIGSHVVDWLTSKGNRVTVYDNLGSGRIEHIAQHIEKTDFRFIHGDLLKKTNLKKALRGQEFIFHLASNPDIAKSITKPDLDLKQGIQATFNVLEAMRTNDVNKIAYTSGSGIYGDAGTTFTPEDYGPLMPTSMYGASKLACEAMISAYCHLYGIQAWVFRMANIVGARQTHGVIYDFIRKLKANPGELEILGDGRQSKSYVHVKDCVEAFFFAIFNSNEKVNTFNIASNDHIDVTSIARIVVEEMGLKDVKFKYTGGSRGWKGDVPTVRLDTTKINKLGWKPKITSEEAVRKATRELLRKE